MSIGRSDRHPWALVAGLVALIALAGVGPAQAHEPSGGIENPTADAKFATRDEVAIRASYSHDGGEVTSVRFTLTAHRPDRQRDSGPVSSPFRWEPGDLGLEYNGKYTVTATPSYRECLGPACSDPQTGSPSAPRSFYLAVPPVQPTDVTTTLNKDKRTVAVSWTGNPEPDLLGYVVQRAKKGGSFTNLAEVEPGDTTYTDDVGGLEGDYSYRVVALREGATGIHEDATNDYEALNSDPSKAATVSIAARPTTTSEETTSTTGGGAGGQEPGSTTTATSEQQSIESQGRVDMSGFAALLDQARARPAPRAAEPDPGFDEELNYGARPPGSTAPPTTAGRPDVEIALADEDQEELGGDRQRSMAFLAGGLFAFVLLMHLLWIRSEVKHVPLEATEPGDESDDGGEKNSDADAVDAAGTLGTPAATPRPAPRKRSQRARGASDRVPSRSRADRREGRPAVRAGS